MGDISLFPEPVLAVPHLERVPAGRTWDQYPEPVPADA